MEALSQICAEQFRLLYGYEPQRRFFSPGRINIIGDHIDYNGGLVFPCAIELGTCAAVAPRKDRKLRLYSHNFPAQAPREFSQFEYRQEYDWCNYVLGMVHVLNEELGTALPNGLDIVFYGNLPSGGSGLSSSASIEVLMGYILLSYCGMSVSREQLAVLAQRAENEFCGMHCGIMDQFVIAVAQENCACLLNCANLEYEQVPLKMSGSYAFLIANTKLPRKLQDSKYNQRRSECEQALALIDGKENLCSITELEEALVLLGDDDVLLRRTRHVVSEHMRTLAAAEAMKASDWSKLGHLMNESHASLRDDYDVSGEHLDTLVSLLQNIDGVSGARMTGAGFGGCAVALVEGLSQSDMDYVAGAYEQKFSWRPEFYHSEAVAGVRELS